MKLSDDDFTSHACDDPNEEGDGLGWNLDTDMTTEGKDELIQNQKLRELVKKEIEGLKPQINELTNFVHPEINSVYFTLRHLLEESKK